MTQTQIEKRPNQGYVSVSLALPDEHNRMLQKLGNHARATGGCNIPKTMIMRALVRLLVTLDVDPSGVKTEDELLERILESVEEH